MSLLCIQATTALAETTAIADFRGLTVFSAIYVVYCNITCYYLAASEKENSNVGKPPL